MGFHDFPDEEPVLGDATAVGQLAFEVGVTFFDERCADLFGGDGRKAEFRKFLHFVAGAIADADRFVDEIGRGKVDDTFLALPDQLETVVLIPNITADERGGKRQHHVPTQRHDVGFTFPRRAHEDDRAGFEVAADFRNGEVLLSVGFHGRLRGQTTKLPR